MLKYLTINGERKRIPSYPHHKYFVWVSYKYFSVRSLLGFLTLEGPLFIPRRIYNNLKARCVVPLVLMIDPTSSCNLRCTGCWAADYQKNSNLSFEKLDETIGEAVRLGVRQIFMTGGEPLMRKDEILELCRRHKGIPFGIFTNGTLIDENLATEAARAGNLNFFISIEGFGEETDMRRGEGTFDKAVRAMELLKKHDIAFGFSACYHSKNYRSVTSDEFLDFVRSKGAWFGWMFNYFPIGDDADLTLCCKPEERAYAKEKIEAYCKKHNYNIIDFANSGHKSIGCVAAANDFAHINANGDLEPCAFLHYSDVNINDMPLAQALRSPFFKKFRKHKPFSKNMLRPCPIMDVPEALTKITDLEGVHSTHMRCPEPAARLAEKTIPLAEAWKPVAEKMYEGMPAAEKRRFGILNWLLQSGNRMISG